jgi:hypothetical protein
MSTPCPKCGRPLEPSGTVTTGDRELPVYQCDECLVMTTLFGEPVETALTFCVGPDGKPFDPATPDGRLLL